MIRRRDVSMLLAPLLGGCSRPGGSTIIRVALITGQNEIEKAVVWRADWRASKVRHAL
jgi:hypothetical protein